MTRDRVLSWFGIAATLTISLLIAPVASASCPVYVYSYVYMEGCGGPPTHVGDDWEECNGAQGGWGTTGNWRERLKITCKIDTKNPPYDCEEDSYTYTWWTKCNGLWLQRTQSQMINGECNCP